jgi:hypothetical protein
VGQDGILRRVVNPPVPAPIVNLIVNRRAGRPYELAGGSACPTSMGAPTRLPHSVQEPS